MTSRTLSFLAAAMFQASLRLLTGLGFLSGAWEQEAFADYSFAQESSLFTVLFGWGGL